MSLKNTKPFNCSAIHPVNWPVKNVLAITTTRHHPFDVTLAKNSYSGFNLGLHVGDETQNVLNNRMSLATLLSSELLSHSDHLKNKQTLNIQWLDQVHGNQVIYLNTQHAFSNTPKVGDAIITQEKNTALAIMTADCLPILLSANDGSEIAAIHGGWKPLAKNIIEKTIAKMLTAPNNISAWLGPCIGSKAFEVGDDVRQCFVQQSPGFMSAFTPIENINIDTMSTPQKYLANLPSIAQQQLNACGIKNISQLNHCTYSMPQDYYSYRKNSQTGRMATVIIRQ